jgi:hypothetical protein
MAIWENRYGQPVTELHDEDGSIDIHIQGFDSPALTPLSEGGEYEFEGLRYRDPDDERAYYEMRPTTGIERLDDSDADSDTDETDTETPETTESPEERHHSHSHQARTQRPVRRLLTAERLNPVTMLLTPLRRIHHRHSQPNRTASGIRIRTHRRPSRPTAGVQRHA